MPRTFGVVHPAVQIAQTPSRPTRGDLLLVSVFLVWAELEAVFVNTGGALWLRMLVGAGYALPLLARRRAPVATMLAIGAVAAAYAYSVDLPDDGAMPFPALLVATFSAGLYVRRLAVSLATGAFPIALVLALSQSPEWQGERQVADYAILSFFVAGAWFAGYAVRRRALQVHAAEQAGGERAREAVAAERVRIARELHDIVAHSVSIIALQAGAAEALVERDPAAAREHMGSVRRTAQDALREMRRLLDVLREDEPVYEPTPELSELDDLVAASRQAGLPVELDESGELANVPPGVAATVYRVVQESLTNVRKHAGLVPTRVVLRRERGRIEVAIENAPGAALEPAVNGGGRGLLGMRERIRIYGGTIDTGSDEDGGFRVRVSIPLAEEGS
jgi:signal transduction histidine kinase